MKNPTDIEFRRITRVRRALIWGESRYYWWTYRRRIREMLNNADGTPYHLSRGQARDIRAFWRGVGATWVNLDWFRLYGKLLGDVNPRFVPEDLFRTLVEPCLCAQRLAAAHADKNLMQRMYPDIPQPLTHLRNMHGQYFNGNYERLSHADAERLLAGLKGDLILKPAVLWTGGGQGVRLLSAGGDVLVEEGRQWTLADIERV